MAHDRSKELCGDGAGDSSGSKDGKREPYRDSPELCRSKGTKSSSSGLVLEAKRFGSDMTGEKPKSKSGSG